MRCLRRCVCGLLAAGCFALLAHGASKAPVIAFGKWMDVEFYVGTQEDQSVPMKVRALYVNGRMREYTLGESHVVTDSQFVVQRAYRLNDLLPRERNAPPLWRWQRGGWLMVNRATGRVSQVSLLHFDPRHSEAAWYRDYVAYCGLSDDGKTVYAVVAQLGRHRPLLKHDLGPAAGDLTDVDCGAPIWQRRPTRITFERMGFSWKTFEIRGHAAEPAVAEPEEPAE